MSAHAHPMPARPGMPGLAHSHPAVPVQRATVRAERPPNDHAARRSLRNYRLTLTVALAAALGGGFVACKVWLEPGDDTAGQAALLETLAPEKPLSPKHQQEQQTTFLVRSTLMALNDANRSGNYSVLRDLAGPRFQERNSVLRLREVFHAFREAGVDLSPAGVLTATLTRSDTRANDGVLALDGSLPLSEAGAIRSLRFAMEFEPIAGHWRLLTLSVGIDVTR